MKLTVDIFQFLVGDMSVYLGGGNIGMTEEFLNNSEINSLL